MTLVRYNPNRLLAEMGRDIDSIFDSLFHYPSLRSSDNWAFVPRVDIIEEKDNMTVVAEIPGMEKDDIKVFVENGVLTISGEKKPIMDKKEDSNYVRCELCTGAFSRSFTLPEHIETDKITADYKNGLLTIVLPKAEKSKPKEIKVAVK
jgi:HSP20 family protein